MKKAIFLVLLLVLSLMPMGCGEESGSGKTAELEFSPLLRIATEESAAKDTRLFYLKESVGFFYVHPDGDGFSAGFVSPHRSISAERILQGEGSVETLSVREEAKDRIFVLTDAGAYTMVLDGATADSSFTPYPPKAAAEEYGFFDSLTVFAEAEELLLLVPVNMSEIYVLAQKALLTDFDSVLTVSDNGKKIWYTRAENGENAGIAFFEYGKNTPLGSENFGFDSARAVGDGKVIFTRALDDGGCLYLYRDLESAAAASVTSEVVYDEVCATPDGKLLAGMKRESGKGYVDIFDLQSGKKKATLPVPFGTPAAIALSSDGGKLSLAVEGGEEMILGTVDM